MEIQYLKEKKILLFRITEELDHHAVEKLRRKADYEIEKYIPRKVVFDFNNVTFMDSAGIGLILGRFKNISVLGGKLEIINVKDTVNKILIMSGVNKIIDINKAETVKIYESNANDLLVNINYNKNNVVCMYDTYINMIENGNTHELKKFNEVDTLFASVDLNSSIVEVSRNTERNIKFKNKLYYNK